MDVRCEKCQTEYELDEARLKPGGVTVKCTNCGHMFKIRKRTVTNVGITSPPTNGSATPASTASGGPTLRDSLPPTRQRSTSSKPQSPPAAPAASLRPRDSMFDDDARTLGDEAPTTVDRQWLIRLENGEQKSCRELATLQQWIVAGVVTRESLISRTGKTWKRLGDIADLGQYFAIADEARVNRERERERARPQQRSGPIASIISATSKDPPGTLPGYGAAQAAGGTILPDDDSDVRTTRAYGQRPTANTPPPVPTRGAARTPSPPSPHPPAPPPAHPSAMPPPPPHAPPSPGLAPTELAPVVPPPPRPGRPTPPPLPPARKAGGPPPPPAIPPPISSRATAAWATDAVKPDGSDLPDARPFIGKLAAAPDEPAFAGRVRMAPGDGAPFAAKVRIVDDDDDVLPARRGSRTGMWVLVVALIAMGGAAAAVYAFVLRPQSGDEAALPAKDAAVVAVAPDAQAAAPAPDATAVAVVSALAGPRAELAADIESRLRTAAQSLDAKPDAPSQALRAHLLAQLAQDLQDRAGLIATPDADGLRRESKQIALDAATAAQRALKAAGDDAGANIAMAEVLRLQGKPAHDIARYLDTARAKPDKDWAVDLALADALVLARDNKLDEARAAFTAIDQGDGKLETSGDVRARYHLALVLAAETKAADARPLVDAILAAQPDHAGAHALSAKLETLVAKTDPLPPEEGGGTSGTGKGPGTTSGAAHPGPPPRPALTPPAATPPATATTPPRPAVPESSGGGAGGGGGEGYDRLLARANAVADSNCGKAMELYAKALEQKPNGVEALTGLGYCQIDAKQFSSAFSKFRAALAVSPRYEPALRGIAETYQQQGRKEQAIEAYRRYLEVYPDSVAAKKQLERLGADPSAPSGGSAPPANPPAAPPAGATPPANPPPATPPPASPPPSGPAPAADPGAGSGSG
jgi:predicted Zn finger-like uncharacterized protein